jgi:hypothetical protein
VLVSEADLGRVLQGLEGSAPADGDENADGDPDRLAGASPRSFRESG